MNLKLAEILTLIYFTIIFVLLAIFLTEINDRYIIYKFIREDKDPLIEHDKTLIRHIIETIIIILILSIAIFYCKKFFVKIPFFLNDVNEINRNKIKDAIPISVLGITFFIFSTGLREKIRILNDRLNN